ncbi:MAG: 1-acyl-sn-glycerol-3-phosphate acyltransferase [Myxococcales bacterium]|nr:1-acyl-sn-glycerol-3-phosphate acyltransferase [Myxococcales bacterium]
MQEAPIFHFNDERAFIVEEVVGRIARNTRDPLLLLNDAAFHEIRRMEPRPGSEAGELSRFRDLARSVGKLSEDERRRKLEGLARHWATDIAGNFNPKVYGVSTSVLPRALALLLSPKDFSEGFRTAGRLQKHLVTQGPLDTLRALSKKGTLVFVPTHLSNLDSVVFGFALHREGLPPVSYGAGKNLFTNPFLSFFMQNLGAYRVDRRVRAELYKEVLKTYSSVLIGRGYHSLFFPGGTRSRAGLVEERLKLGLMGTGVEAYVDSLRRGHEQRVFFVPATINYLLTLEASTLIADYLAEVGRNRYIIEDDESTQLERIATLVRKLVLTTGSVVIRFAQPIDPFGNRVLADGRSVDPRGREVDPRSYVTRRGQPVHDAARDAQYTRELGEAICGAYSRETVLLATHLVAGAAFKKLQASYPGEDLFKLLRHRDELFVPGDELERRIADITDAAKALEDQGKIVLAAGLRQSAPGAILSEALRAWSGYHTNAVLAPSAGGFMLSDTNLLLYYQNRLAASGLGFHPGVRR